MNAFDYTRPDTLSDVLDRLEHNTDARPIAGGMTLLPAMKQRLAAPSELVDLGGVGFLSDVEQDEDGAITIGAMARHAMVAASPLIGEHLPALAALAGGIGDPQVRNRGTIGGSVANNDPAADYPAGLLALEAVVLTDCREIAADDFFVGIFETALEEGELIVGVRFPVGRDGAYSKFRHPISGYAMAGVFVARSSDDVRVAVTGAGPVVYRWTEAEERLRQAFSVNAILDLRSDPTGLSSDMHASAIYRAQLVNVMLRRAVAQIVG